MHNKIHPDTYNFKTCNIRYANIIKTCKSHWKCYRKNKCYGITANVVVWYILLLIKKMYFSTVVLGVLITIQMLFYFVYCTVCCLNSWKLIIPAWWLINISKTSKVNFPLLITFVQLHVHAHNRFHVWRKYLIYYNSAS